jgi:hypothetical protein
LEVARQVRADRPQWLASARLPVTTTIALALLAELILIETRNPQLLAHLLARLPLACLAITPAIALTLLSEPILVFASEPQLFALASGTPTSTIIHADAARSGSQCFELRLRREQRTPPRQG